MSYVRDTTIKTKILIPGLGLAIIFAPLVAGAATANTTISSAISPVISLFTTSGTVNVNVTPTASGAQTIASDTVTTSTNDSSGYTLTLADQDTNTNLVSGSNNVAANAGTQTTPTALVAGKWGYRVDGVGGFGAGPTSAASNQAIAATTFAGMPSSASPNTLKTTATTASSDTTTVWYGVAANTSQPTGVYTDIVTYTATAN